MFVFNAVGLPPPTIDCVPLLQFNLSMTGGRSAGDIRAFWDHCFQHEEWLDHPAKYLAGVVRERTSFEFETMYLVCFFNFQWQHHCVSFTHRVTRVTSFALGLLPVALHVDGAEFYSNSERYVWSWGSILPTGEAAFVDWLRCVN